MASTNHNHRRAFGRHRRSVRLAGIAFATAAILACIPVASQAATTARIGTSGNVYVNSGGEANTVNLTDTGSEIWILDSSAAVFAGSGCVQYNSGNVYCPYPSGVWRGLFVQTNGGGDHITLHRYGSGDDPIVWLSGGGESDTILGSSFRETINGGAGPDSLTGNGGYDDVFGDEGGDNLFVRDAVRDKAECGAGVRDYVQRDLKLDTVSGCEMLG